MIFLTQKTFLVSNSKKTFLITKNNVKNCYQKEILVHFKFLTSFH